MRSPTAALVLVVALAGAGCRKPPPSTPAAVTPAPAPAFAQMPAPHLGGAPPGKAQTRVRQVMDRVRAETQLHTIGQFFQLYKNDFNRYPPRLEDFLEYIKTDARQEHESLQTGYFVLNLTQNPAGDTVLVYEAEPDNSGLRLALMGDCASVQRLSEDQFKTAVPTAKK